MALACALAIWRGDDLDAEGWQLVARHRGAYDGTLFPSLRWQVDLLDCRLDWRAGRLDASIASLVRAFESANWLSEERFGDVGPREREFAMRTIATRAPELILQESGIGARVQAGSPAFAVSPQPAALQGRSGTEQDAFDAPESRAAAGHFERLARRENSAISLTAAARVALLALEWPRDERQLRELALAVAESSAGVVTPETLSWCGLAPAQTGDGLSLDDSDVRAILIPLESGRLLSVGELESVTGVARRTVQRKLKRLVDAGVLRRSGLGRSVRYATRVT